MKKMLFTIIIALFVVLSIQLPLFVAAEDDDDDIMIGDFELEKLLNLGSGFLASGLFILTLCAYNRNQNKRLLYVSTAFFLFAIKSFLVSMEIFFSDWSWVDPTASILDFVILLSFFFGIIITKNR